MRKLIVNEFLTLDGVMQGPGSPDEDRRGGFQHGGWHLPYFDEDQLLAATEGIAETDAYLFGRRTYEIMAGYWPHQPDTAPFAKTLNELPKYVVSTTLTEPLGWRNSRLIRGDVVEEVARLKQQPGRNIAVLGSGELVQTLIRHELVDEYALMIDPIVVGSGIRLFREGLPLTRLRVVGSLTTSTGVLVVRYVPAPAAEMAGSAPATAGSAAAS